MDLQSLMIPAFVCIAVAGFLYVFIYPYFSGEAQAEKRKKALAKGTPVSRRANDRTNDAAARNKRVAESLKEMEAKGKQKKRSLDNKIAQAGLDIDKQKFYLASGVGAIAVAGLLFFMSGDVIYALPGLLIGGFGLPHWVLGFLRTRRTNKFIHEFPNAVDVIIRGIKAGLPLGDCLRIIATEAVEPVRSEFRLIVEAQTMGLSVGEAVERIVERVPTAEANFFSIVINIQQKAGGNLSEALGNLSRVLRDRKKMKLKIKAMSSEAKASAGIIGALPFLVSGMVYLSSPTYIELLWTTSSGRVVMAVCGFWMFIGVMAMRKMISFDI